MGRLIDTHAHLCSDEFERDLPAVLARAQASGVAAVICVGETLDDAKKNLALTQTHPMVKPAAGLYPTHLDLKQAEEVTAWIRHNRTFLFAIGEVGLDYWVVKTEEEKTLQREIFQQFIALSRETGLPLNVHSRSAGRHAIALLLENQAVKVQMHAFDGKYGAAMAGVEAGFYFSIPPSVVRSRQKQKLVKQLPLSCLLVETDSPVLGPVPGRRNEPANIGLTVQAIARIKEISEERVKEEVSENTMRLYGML